MKLSSVSFTGFLHHSKKVLSPKRACLLKNLERISELDNFQLIGDAKTMCRESVGGELQLFVS